jgi:hypothetical protein
MLGRRLVKDDLGGWLEFFSSSAIFMLWMDMVGKREKGKGYTKLDVSLPSPESLSLLSSSVDSSELDDP